MIEYLLIILLNFEIGIREPVTIQGDLHPSLEQCLEHGDRTAQWLTQDFVIVRFRCVPQPVTKEVRQ